MDNILTLTMHRAENVDDKQRVTSIIEALKELSDMNIIFPIHPRTKNTLQKFGLFGCKQKTRKEIADHRGCTVQNIDALYKKAVSVVKDSLEQDSFKKGD